MKVKELIELLKKTNPDDKIIVEYTYCNTNKNSKIIATTDHLEKIGVSIEASDMRRVVIIHATYQ
jgi:hypothetical protein